jgi:hypothetical protein
MTSKSNSWVVAIVVLLLFAAIFYFGYVMHGVWTEPDVVIDTITEYDTIEHHIISQVPYYIVKVDTILKSDTIIIHDTIQTIDATAAIIQAYFSVYNYKRVWEDSLLKVTLSDVVSQNKILDSDFSYKIMKPQTIINNTISYSRYLYLGGTVNIPEAKGSSLGVFFASKRMLIGSGYIPYQKGVSLTGSFTIGKFR